MFRVISNYPTDPTSADLKEPLRPSPENPSKFALQALQLFGRPIQVLDLGCGENALIQAFYELGSSGIGLDIKGGGLPEGNRGSYPPKTTQILALCDFSQPFRVVDEAGDHICFDLITSWESFEHIDPTRRNQMCHNIFNHLAPDGMFLGSINLTGSSAGPDFHRNLITEEEWIALFRQFFDVENYPLRERFRWQPHSFYVKLTLPGNSQSTYEFGQRVCPNCRRATSFQEGPGIHTSCRVCGYVATRYLYRT